MKENHFYLKMFLMILLFTVLSACDSVTPSSPIINSFIASPSDITVGESSTLNWSVTDSDTISIYRYIYNRIPNHNYHLYPYGYQQCWFDHRHYHRHCY